jgi:hypothetical protein
MSNPRYTYKDPWNLYQDLADPQILDRLNSSHTAEETQDPKQTDLTP